MGVAADVDCEEREVWETQPYNGSCKVIGTSDGTDVTTPRVASSVAILAQVSTATYKHSTQRIAASQ